VSEVWLPPEKHRDSQTALPQISPPASRMRVHDGRVGLGDVAFEHRGAVHHREARDADVSPLWRSSLPERGPSGAPLMEHL
jgi:hypothetical protein